MYKEGHRGLFEQSSTIHDKKALQLCRHFPIVTVVSASCEVWEECQFRYRPLCGWGNNELNHLLHLPN